MKGQSVFRFLCPDTYKPTKSKLVKEEKIKKPRIRKYSKDLEYFLSAKKKRLELIKIEATKEINEHDN